MSGKEFCGWVIVMSTATLLIGGYSARGQSTPTSRPTTTPTSGPVNEALDPEFYTYDIVPDALPGLVKLSVKIKYPKGKITEAAKQVRKSGTCYLVMVETPDDEFELRVTPAGSVLEKRNEDEHED